MVMGVDSKGEEFGTKKLTKKRLKQTKKFKIGPAWGSIGCARGNTRGEP
jgi:hypothetical protein